jgi:hypothetical protein
VEAIRRDISVERLLIGNMRDIGEKIRRDKECL